LGVVKQGFLEFFNIKHCPSKRNKGYQGQELPWEGSGLEKILSKNDSLIAKREPEIVLLFDTFLRYCKENDIQVILVFTPLYIKATDYTADKEEVMQIYHSFSEKYNIPFLDYSHDPLCYDTIYFHNAMHLNKKGAELFSLKLANDIKQVLK
jgi:lysophospholipase L1-like esterase